ncbi:hypothetical protein HYW67_02070 [Candidatus Parcubacteria bacterium]|nr:hypothetical protein [Candidatus Parcubacteria bacterium]
MDHDEEIYYKELHQTARHYDTKLWTVLGVSLVVIGWLATGFDFADFVSIKNILILFTAGVVSHLLLLKFIKEHAHTLWIQKR